MKHFINLKDIPVKDLRKIIVDAKKRKKLRKNLNTLEVDKGAPLKGKLLIQMFEKSSLRTRLSFELAMTVGSSVMDIISNKKFLKNVKSISKFFLFNLNKIKNEYPNIIKEIRGRGLLIGIQLKTDQTKFIKKLMDNNLLTIRAAENVVRILPPLNVKKNEINQSLKIIKKVCSELN